jgi:hypothetical protein
MMKTIAILAVLLSILAPSCGPGPDGVWGTADDERGPSGA